MKFCKTLPDDYVDPDEGKRKGIGLKGCLQLAIPIILFWVLIIYLFC